MPKCIFCSITDRSVATELIYEDEYVVAFHDVKPVAPIHILVVPRVHIENVADLGHDSDGVMTQLTRVANQIARQFDIKTAGYRLVVNSGSDGGQTVPHLHMHLLGGHRLPELAR